MTAGGETIPFQSLVAIHWVHRLFALFVVGVVGALIWHLWAAPGLKRPAWALLALLFVQLATGMSNVVLQWPLLLAVAHSGGAALLAAQLVAVNHRLARAGR